MREEIIRCDCCGKKNVKENEVIRLTLPIITSTCDGHFIAPHEMDLCTECGNEISRCYYRIAQEHNSSGIMGITETIGEDE